MPIQVLCGPFKGLRYYERIVWGPITPKWIGSYEAELHEIVRKIIETGYNCIIDIGAAEGYYAVGFAWKCKETKVVAYDIDPIARRRQKQLAALNGIENLVIRKYCDHKKLSKEISGKTLVVCDVEGFEVVLLDPAKARELERADILVELHPFGEMSAQAVEDLIVERFVGTHIVTKTVISPREPLRYSASVDNLKNIDLEVLTEAMNEYRIDSQSWLWLKAEQSDGGNY